jgi:2'-5' RNA ligase
MTAEVEMMRDHWWWRPGWRIGRHFHACHFAMDRYPGLVRLVGAYRKRLVDFPGLDLIPDRWLHLTTQGVGFVDEVTEAQWSRLRDELWHRLAAVAPPVVTFHRPVVRGEAIYLPATPVEGLIGVRAVIREAIAQVLRPRRLPEGSEPAARFRPHVSLAYANAAQPAQPVAEALAEVVADPVTVTLDRIDLMVFHRDRRMYEWTSSEPVPIGG